LEQFAAKHIPVLMLKTTSLMETMNSGNGAVSKFQNEYFRFGPWLF
jgi:hypothetical protein